MFKVGTATISVTVAVIRQHIERSPDLVSYDVYLISRVYDGLEGFLYIVDCHLSQDGGTQVFR